MVLSLEDAVTILNKWKDDSAHILVVSESPFQQSRRGILEQRIDWAIGLQGKVSKVAVNHRKKGEKKGTGVVGGFRGPFFFFFCYFCLLFVETRVSKPDVG